MHGLVGSLVAACTAVGVLATPAQADDIITPVTWATRGYAYGAGEGVWHSYGETLALYDRKADGAGVTAYLFVNGSLYTQKTCTSGASSGCNYNFSFPEGLSVRLDVCLEDDGTVIAESCDTRYGTT
ncbi:hypothetical protein AN217_09355 [Streptomyces qinglanensis]|uniref:Secreted protein n=1 Tax=Streptomyces qinglanensis TaxID=943816 RepID=A0A1E7K248_9ACTN|nr:hypothetical protein AN217_09355 [Streptomyces qinglanensis]OEV07221.1 hypothetical protein AN220_34830 [Streptomyces nanshensis]